MSGDLKTGSSGTSTPTANPLGVSKRAPSIQQVKKLLAAVIITFCLLFCAGRALAEPPHARYGAVATVSPIATEAAIGIMEQGGNAIDAAVMAGLTLGVVDGYNSGLGGGCFMMIHLKDGRTVAVDGREVAPARAFRDMYLTNGVADGRLSTMGVLAAGVPGALGAYSHASSEFGKIRLPVLLQQAADIAEKGFPISNGYHKRLRDEASSLASFEASRSIFLKPGGEALAVGDVLKQLDLAKSYRHIASEGIDWFYKGEFARTIDHFMQANRGILSASDMMSYQIELREPIKITYRGYTILGFPPPSSGGVHVAEILNILEHFNLRKMGQGSAEAVHVIAEAMKLAFADRAWWLGDPKYAPVPKGLISKQYARKLAKRISMETVLPQVEHGVPEDASKNWFGKHTTHFSTADREGNWVACTATINTTFGSKVVVPGTGIVLNNQMDDFAIQPGVPNYFGLIGNEANAIQPGKRPLSSMSPTVVMKSGKPVLGVGAAGGPTIISQTLLAIVNVIDFGMEVNAALAGVRFHQQWRPDELRIERAAGAEVIAALKAKGHKVVVVASIGASQAVAYDPSKHRFSAAADPRQEGRGEVR